MTPLRLNRRRFLSIGAAVAATPFLGTAARATEARWQGTALGAHASMRLIGLSDAEAAPVFAGLEAEIHRLERIFSLYSTDSSLCRLNRDGALAAPPAELLEVLTLAREAYELTDGLFDPTVQPLFRHYVEGNSTLGAALSLTGLDGLRTSQDRVTFDRPGMAMTLNGIAQGYVTDRVAARLRSDGFTNVLVDIGEIAAIGSGAAGTGWRVGLSAPDGKVTEVLTVTDRAVATSSPLGTVLDKAGRIGHILHPRKGAVPARYGRVTVVHDSAAMADALSTAAALMDGRQIGELRRRELEVVTG